MTGTCFKFLSAVIETVLGLTYGLYGFGLSIGSSGSGKVRYTPMGSHCRKGTQCIVSKFEIIL
jgi:hypothetical protein